MHLQGFTLHLKHFRFFEPPEDVERLTLRAAILANLVSVLCRKHRNMFRLTVELSDVSTGALSSSRDAPEMTV